MVVGKREVVDESKSCGSYLTITRKMGEKKKALSPKRCCSVDPVEERELSSLVGTFAIEIPDTSGGGWSGKEKTSSGETKVITEVGYLTVESPVGLCVPLFPPMVSS